VGDVARIAGGLPEFSIPVVPLTLQTLGARPSPGPSLRPALA
jgi:hypothetical protein